MKLKYLSLFAAAFLLLVWVSLNSGVVKLNNVLALLFGHGSSDQVAIMQEIRAPRIAAAVLVGAILGIGGALSQGALRNPLAEPVLLGTTGGAALFTLAGILFLKLSIGSIAAIALGILGALAATLFTYSIGKSGKDGYVFVIVGIAVSATLTALVGITAVMINKPEAKGVTFWTLGTLSMSTKAQALILTPIFLASFASAIYIAPNLDYLALGDLRAKHLGKSVLKIRLITFLIIAVAVGAVTSIFGQISFLALAIPHIVRALIGPKHRNLIVHSALLGATLLLLADLAARTLAEPNELPIGLMTALIGAPILAISARKWVRNA